MVHPPQLEQQLRPPVQPRTHPVQRRRHVLAHHRPVRTRTRQRELLRLRKQPAPRPRDHLHHRRRQLPLQQRHQRTDPPRTLPADPPPSRPVHRLDPDLHLVHLRPRHLRQDLPLREPQVQHVPVPYVRPTSRHPVREIRIPQQVVAPRLPPERVRQLAPLQHHRLQRLPLLPQLLQLRLRLRPLLPHRYVRRPVRLVPRPPTPAPVSHRPPPLLPALFPSPRS